MLLLVVLAVLLARGAAVAQAPVWPQPAKFSGAGTGSVGVVPSPNFFTLSGGANDFLSAAFARYEPLVFPHSPSKAGVAGVRGVTSLNFEVEDLSDDHPQLNTDESYLLSVPADSSHVATVKAKTVYGALRGLETFSQLVKFDFDANRYTISGAPIAIDDAPRFPHRGLMIDSARHYLSLPAIREIIDTLPYGKMNVLHWHMTDTESFPLQVKSSPKLWVGAYSGAERYTQQDVASIIEYAKLRGIRVIVEFDMPGHAQSWCKGYPEICPSPTCTTPLNVANNATFDLIENLIREITGGKPSSPSQPRGLFPDDFMHLGGDEVDTSCWGKTPDVAAWLKAKGMSEDDGYAYFVKRVAQMVIDQGHRPVQWSEVFDHFKGKLPKETIIHVWKDFTNVTEVLALGYNVLRNVGYDNISWYLDNIDKPWDALYQNEPCAGIQSDELCKLVLGGHGEMWGETVDGSDLQQTVWPRLAAIAEKLWSPRASTQDGAAALPRIRAFRCLLLQRGVAAAPVDNKNARSAPSGPASCYAQLGSFDQIFV